VDVGEGLGMGVRVCRTTCDSVDGVTRKNLQVPCLDRSQSSAVMAASRAMTRSWAISSLKSSARFWTVARIAGANMTRVNVTGILDTIAMSKMRSGPLSASWTMPRALAIGTASASARCGRGPRVMGWLLNKMGAGAAMKDQSK
jgi:hypothetical protein